jgi:hypothetical protein
MDSRTRSEAALRIWPHFLRDSGRRGAEEASEYCVSVPQTQEDKKINQVSP